MHPSNLHHSNAAQSKDNPGLNTWLNQRTSGFQVAFFGAVFASAIILIPLLASFISTEMDWSLFDFVLIWTLLFCAGALYKWITLFANDRGYRAAVGLSIFTGVFIIWSNLGVGIVGSEDEAFNLLYFALLGIGLIAAFWVRFKAKGMAIVMLSLALGLVLIMLLAFGFGLHRIPQSSSIQIIAIHFFLMVPMLLTAILFHHAANDQAGE
jgi:MFS family permease